MSFLARIFSKKKPVQQALPQMQFKKKTFRERMFQRNAKWYEIDAILYMNNEQVGIFPLTVKAFSKKHAEFRIENEFSLKATNIRFAKPNK